MSTTHPAGSLIPARRIPGSRSSLADSDRDGTGTPQTRRRDPRTGLLVLVGLAAVGFTAVYLISDLIEVAQGGFSTFRLWLTCAGEAAIPLFVIGLYAVQRPRIGRLGLIGGGGLRLLLCVLHQHRGLRAHRRNPELHGTGQDFRASVGTKASDPVARDADRQDVLRTGQRGKPLMPVRGQGAPGAAAPSPLVCSPSRPL